MIINKQSSSFVVLDDADMELLRITLLDYYFDARSQSEEETASFMMLSRVRSYRDHTFPHTFWFDDVDNSNIVISALSLFNIPPPQLSIKVEL